MGDDVEVSRVIASAVIVKYKKPIGDACCAFFMLAGVLVVGKLIGVDIAFLSWAGTVVAAFAAFGMGYAIYQHAHGDENELV